MSKMSGRILARVEAGEAGVIYSVGGIAFGSGIHDEEAAAFGAGGKCVGMRHTAVLCRAMRQHLIEGWVHAPKI